MSQQQQSHQSKTPPPLSPPERPPSRVPREDSHLMEINTSNKTLKSSIASSISMSSSASLIWSSSSISPSNTPTTSASIKNAEAPPPQPPTPIIAAPSTPPRNSSSSSEQDNHIQFLMDALEKLNPDKNDLSQVPREITSSTLTTRLRGVCKINRLIDHANDLCHSFSEIGAKAKYQERIDKFRSWILERNIIEHIFGPNCHVEIIKQSHTILNFVAYSLNEEHVNVIWSASSLKHCGRQVLDLLTSLVRFMRTSTVLHLYWLVKNLSVEDHTEHTLLLTSHILRFIWSHSPCINQVHFCSIQKSQPSQVSPTDQENDPRLECEVGYRYVQNSLNEQILVKQRLIQIKKHKRSSTTSNDLSGDGKLINQDGGIYASATSTANIASTNTSTADYHYTKPKREDEEAEWFDVLGNANYDDQSTERSISDHSASDLEFEKDLHQSILDAIKGVSRQKSSAGQHQRRANSPASETIAKGGDNLEPADEVKNSVVNHILKTISADEQSSEDQQSSQKKQSLEDVYEEPPDASQQSPEKDDRVWLPLWKVIEDPYMDFNSDVSACCSEEKNMDDFDDEPQSIPDENTNGADDPSANSSSSDIFVRVLATRMEHPDKGVLKESSRIAKRDLHESSTSTHDSDSKPHPSLDPNTEHFQQMSAETIAHFLELKKASLNLSNLTTQVCADEDLRKLSEYNLANLSESGKTLLWDLLQDGKIEYLGSNLYVEVENALVNLVMSFGDRYIRYKFIEACLENLSTGNSVIISLRLLPRFMSFNTMARGLSIPAVNETYTIVLWAEREHNMSKNFFRNLVEYYDQRKKQHCESICDSNSGVAQPGDCIKMIDDMDESTGKLPLFTHIDSIITRMSFLTFIYSKPYSPVSMKLDRDHMDQLWGCLTSDSNLRCADVLFQWIYQQAVVDDYHGVDDELLDYVLKCKLPTLSPERFRLRGLKLLEQLLWIRQDYECCHELEHPATRTLWDIALRAVDDEVSMSAIRILNHFYIYTNHQKPVICKQGTNFMGYCMEHLQSSLDDLKNSKNLDETSHSLEVMQKVILLIRTHLEVFKAHWSYYLRILQLNNEADLISHRLNAYDIKLTMTIRLVIQAASNMNKTTIEVQATDFIGEFRAEIVKWWYSQVDRSYHNQSVNGSPASSTTSASSRSTGLNSFTTFLLNNHHSLRLLSQNQEIPFDWDERQVNELDFKDMQIIYVLNDTKPPNVDSADDMDSEKSEEAPQVYFPELSTIPSIVLQRDKYFECLMEVHKYLVFRCDNIDLTIRAKTLSRRVWEIVQILPTEPHYKWNLEDCGHDDDSANLKQMRFQKILNPDCPQRLLYSLQIIDILKSSQECPSWGSVFIRKGGLADLYEVFMSQKLLPEDGEEWNEWLQECLAYLLKLLFQFATRNATSTSPTDQCETSSTANKVNFGQGTTRMQGIAASGSIRRLKRNRNRFHSVTEERILIPQFSSDLLKLLGDTEKVFDRLMAILKSSAFCKSQNDHHYYVAISSRAMIVHHTMSFLSSWCKSDPKFPEIQVQNYQQLLKSLILDDTDQATRREACNGFFKLHYACLTRSNGTVMDTSTSSESPTLTTSNSDTSSVSINESTTNNNFSAELLACLIKFLPIAEAMRPPKPIRNCLSESEYLRELNASGCKDYFWLTCRLIDAPNTCGSQHNLRVTPSAFSDEPNESRQNLEAVETEKGNELKESELSTYHNSSVNLLDLCKYLMLAIRKRPTFETRDYTVEDDTLRGMLMMMVMSIRRDPTFRYTEEAMQFILELYGYLFAPPTEQCRFLPKCKSGATRSTAFDLMIALVEHCPKNYMTLLNQLLNDQHQAVVKGSYPTDYWPHDDCRSEVGFVGLINLGATCYLATCMQHLFMIPDLRYAILSIQDPKSIRHGEIIRELQKIFAFMLESERKAYNPRNFCKVYTMDNHPLNIAEQTDMTEFLTDLITKIEESSPVLRQIIKSLFSGTLSNNVVSLDCPHISRTTEEFYTLRVQVADMRNLNDSLDELTVKDTLEGDNMYTCSTCEKKVRAEKRACIVKLPRILCFNTMRYTFNMTTMTKEKVNTHFSFPLKLDMADYLEANLMKRQQSSPISSNCPSRNSSGSAPDISQANETKAEPRARDSSKDSSAGDEKMQEDNSVTRTESRDENHSQPGYESSPANTLYELIGVTVHTGNADGGHYYCFIRDCEDNSTDKPRWYLFNDAEVKPFDDSHIGTECYGGELTTKSYDAINDRFMDFSIEKTNSAYMLFYKRVDYKYRSKSVALRYLESDTERYLTESSQFSQAVSFSNKQEIETSDVEPTVQDQPDGLTRTFSPTDTISKPGPSISLTEKSSQSVRLLLRILPGNKSSNLNNDEISSIANRYNSIFSDTLNFEELCQLTYEDFVLPRHLANWIWMDNMKFSRDQCIFEHNYFDFMWQICANVPRTHNIIPRSVANKTHPAHFLSHSEDSLAIETVHLAIIFVLGVLMNSRERPNLTNWTELIRKQFNSNRAACDWLMQLIDDDETWLKQMLLRCPIEMVRQLFQRLCNDLTGSKQHKRIRLVK